EQHSKTPEPPMQTDTPYQGTAPQTSPRPQTPIDESIQAVAPGQLRVIKRNGAVVGYDLSKITVAITKAYLAVEGGNAAASSRVHDMVAKLVVEIANTFKRRMPSGGSIHIEEIQDQVELMLMRSGEHKVARAYVIYRAEQARKREQNQQQKPESEQHPSLQVVMADGATLPLDTGRLRTVINEACAGLDGVDGEKIYQDTLKNLYSGVKFNDVQ